MCKLQVWKRQLPFREIGLEEGKRRKIRLIEGNAKCRRLKYLTCIGTLQQVFICLRPHPLLDSWLGWSSNVEGSESGQMQSVQLLQNMVSNRTLYPTPSPLHTVYVYSILIHTGKGRGVEFNQREGRAATGESTDHKAVSKIPT